MAVPRSVRRRSDLPLGARALEWLRALPDHRLLDRLIGGRIWIVLLGTLLVGIVTMQLSLLRLNAGIGRAVERGSALEQRNAALRLSISRLSDSERIAALATRMGFVTPPQGSPVFLTASAADAGRALTTMRVPDPAALAAAAAALTTTADPAAADTTVTDTGTTAPPVDTTSADGTTAPAATTDPGTTTDTTATAPSATGTGTTGASGTTAPATPTTPVTAGGASVPVGNGG